MRATNSVHYEGVGLNSLFQRLRDSATVRLGAAYLVGGWVIIQVVVATFSRIGVPIWYETTVIYSVGVGFLPFIIIVWVRDLGRKTEAEPEDISSFIGVRPVTGKPSIAVLPFVDGSQGTENAYMAQGMTEEIATLLSQLPDLFITGQNSSMLYADADTDAQTIAKELGVRYLLRGSVQATGGQVRVTSQLTDGETGNQVWADRYSGSEDTLFDVQDQVSREIASLLGGEIMLQEIMRIERRPPENLNAWENYVLAQNAYYRQESDEKYGEVIKYAERAIAEDPGFAHAHSLLAAAASSAYLTQTTDDPEGDRERAVVALDAAMRMSPDDPRILAECANANSNLLHPDRALDLALRAVARAPCFAGATSMLGLTYLTLGEADNAIEYLERSMQASPRDAQMPQWLYWLCWAYTLKDEYQTALAMADRSIERAPEAFLAWVAKTNVLGYLGRHDEAREAAARTKELFSDFSAALTKEVADDFFATPEISAKIYEGMHLAGID